MDKIGEPKNGAKPVGNEMKAVPKVNQKCHSSTISIPWETIELAQTIFGEIRVQEKGDYSNTVYLTGGGQMVKSQIIMTGAGGVKTKDRKRGSGGTGTLLPVKV